MVTFFVCISQIIAKVSVDNRTRALVQGLYRASDVRVFINRVEDLSYHLLQFPDTCGVAVKVTQHNILFLFVQGYHIERRTAAAALSKASSLCLAWVHSCVFMAAAHV